MLAHDQRADALSLQVSVHGQRAEVDVRFGGVALGPGRYPPAHPRRRARPESDEVGEQPDPLRRRRLARSRGRNAGQSQQLAIPNGADRLLSGKRTEQAAHQTRVTTEAVLWILAVGRYVERVVPHPAREDADGFRDLVRSQSRTSMVTPGPAR